MACHNRRADFKRSSIFSRRDDHQEFLCFCSVGDPCTFCSSDQKATLSAPESSPFHSSILAVQDSPSAQARVSDVRFRCEHLSNCNAGMWRVAGLETECSNLPSNHNPTTLGCPNYAPYTPGQVIGVLSSGSSSTKVNKIARNALRPRG